MRTITFFICLLLSIVTLKGQNLVFNGSFENVDTFKLKQWMTTIYNVDYIRFCPLNYWFATTDDRAPVFLCDTINNKQPYRILTNQLPKAHYGHNFIGMIILSGDGYAQHITGELKEPLQYGRKYYVRFYVHYANDISSLAIRGIGVKFTRTTSIFPNKASTFGDKMLGYNSYYFSKITKNLKADVESPDDIILNDTNWVKIEGYYIAQGGEHYITIGKFYDSKIKNHILKRYSKVKIEKKYVFLEKHNDMISLNPNRPKHFDYGAFYFIDDVSVIPIDDENSKNIPKINITFN
jgi:hypothetical protein